MGYREKNTNVLNVLYKFKLAELNDLKLLQIVMDVKFVYLLPINAMNVNSLNLSSENWKYAILYQRL